MEAIATTVGRLNSLDAMTIVKALTKHGSEFQREVQSRESSLTPIAVVRDGDHRVASWVAVHEWRGMQSLQGFTHPDVRRRGYARLAAATLAANGDIEPSRTTAVFSPDFIGIASAIRCKDVRLFQRSGDDWTETS